MHSTEFTFAVLTVKGERILTIYGVYVPSNELQDTRPCIYTVIKQLVIFSFSTFYVNI